jgi:hypothetical protein
MQSRLLTLSLLVITFHVVWSQDIQELERRNGFKDIKLGNLVDSVKGATPDRDIIERKEFPAKIYRVDHPDYKKIGDVPIKEIELKTYRGYIYQIIVITAKDAKVMQALEKAFGKATYTVRTESWYWKADNISLTYKGHHKHISLTYKSGPVIKMMYDDKGKQVEAVAEDF